MPSGEISARDARDLRATSELVVTLVLFGSSFPAFKLATERFGVGTVVGLRFALATATLIVIFRGLPVLEPRMWRRLLLIGAVGLGGQAVTMIAGIDAGSSTLGALVLGLEPIGVAVAAVLVARERPTPSTLAGLGLGLAGVAVVSGLFTSGVSGEGRAVAFLLLTVVLFAAYTVSVRREAARIDAGAVALVTSIGACIVTLPLIALDVAHGRAVQGELRRVVGGGRRVHRGGERHRLLPVRARPLAPARRRGSPSPCTRCRRSASSRRGPSSASARTPATSSAAP